MSQCTFAFVTTNSLNQGLSVSLLWPEILRSGAQIVFAHRSFRWSNLASKNAGVTVIVVGLSNAWAGRKKVIYEAEEARAVSNINAYLVNAPDIYIEPRRDPLSALPKMEFGNMPRDGGYLILNPTERDKLLSTAPAAAEFVAHYLGSEELINGQQRFCIWVDDKREKEARSILELSKRFDAVADARTKSPASATRAWSSRSHRFVQVPGVGRNSTLVIAGVSSETREYLPVGLLGSKSVVSNLAFAVYDGALWNLALIVSRLHLVWVAAVCGKLETRYRYSNTLGRVDGIPAMRI